MTNNWRSYDSIADAYDVLWTPRFVTVARRLLALAGPIAGLRVLDLGTGTGAVARACGDSLPTVRRLIGCDLARRMLAKARLPPPFHVVAGDMLGLPLRDATFDLVTANCVLSHASNHRAALREIQRVLTRPGTLLASSWVPSADPAMEAWSELLDAALGPGAAERATLQVSPLEAFFSAPENVRDALSAAGFQTVRIEEFPYSSEHSVEEYIAERSLNAPGRLARHTLGEAGWQDFVAEARTRFGRRFGERIGFSRRVLLAAATVR